jgi:hypothetical protein
LLVISRRWHALALTLWQRIRVLHLRAIAAPMVEDIAMRSSIPSLFAAAVIACIASGPAAAATMPPDFSAAVFDPAQPIDNPYFPMTSSATHVYLGHDDDGPVDERFEHTNIGPGPVIAGVQTSIQRDREFEDGLLVEETFDYFAQDTAGNVWYLGEDVTNFIYDDDGNLIDTNTEGAWRAGVNEAEPGFIMPADLTIGFNYFQEFAAAEEALDQGTIFAFIDLLVLDIGTFENVLQILETTELEPDALEFKYYALGVGLLLVEEDLDEDLANPELVFELSQIRSVPEPGTAGLLLLGLVVGASVPLMRRRTHRC